jgi:hypothetical protein
VLTKLSFGIIRAAAPVVTVLCMNLVEDTNIPSRYAQYEPTCQYRQWEEETCCTALPYQVIQFDNSVDELQVIQSFIEHLMYNSIDLKPEAVDMVNRRYRDLI